MPIIETAPGLLILAFLRYLPALVLPAFSPLRWAPPAVRIAIVLALSWIAVLASPSGATIPNDISGLGWLMAAMSELAIGVAFGLAVALPMAALHTGGWLIDVQAGIAAATIFNPGSQGESQSLFGMAIILLVTVLFFTLDLQLDMLRGIVASTKALPLGQVGFRPDSASTLAAVGSSFLLGFMVTAPIVIGLFAVDIGVAYATRSMPQANVYFLALPLKVLITMLLLASSLKLMPLLVSRLFHDSYLRTPSILGI